MHGLLSRATCISGDCKCTCTHSFHPITNPKHTWWHRVIVVFSPYPGFWLLLLFYLSTQYHKHLEINGWAKVYDKAWWNQWTMRYGLCTLPDSQIKTLERAVYSHSQLLIMWWSVLAGALFCLPFTWSDKDFYIASLYSYNPEVAAVSNRTEAVRHMNNNVDILEKQLIIAKSQVTSTHTTVNFVCHSIFVGFGLLGEELPSRWVRGCNQKVSSWPPLVNTK